MKLLRVLSLAALVSLPGIVVPGVVVQCYGQEKRDEKQAKPEKQQAQPRQQAQPKEKAQAQPRQQAQPKEKAQAQPRQQAQPREKAQAQPRQQAQPKAKAQAQPRQQQQRAQQPKEQARQSNPTAGRNSSYTPPQRTRQQAQTWQQQSSWRQGAWQGQATWQGNRSSNWASDHRGWGQRGGYGGYYIPDASFGLYFGDDHWFRISSQPYIVGGYPRFRYQGFTFMMVDPWPSDWAENWYSADDVYVGYDNGYYLYDRAHPGEGVAISVVL